MNGLPASNEVSPSGKGATKHLPWIDACKGCAITCVVVGHLTESPALHDSIYIWHMPFFFFMSGYTFQPTADTRRNLLNKSIRFLVPYACFLALLSIPELMDLWRDGSAQQYVNFFIARAAGGRLLHSWFVAAWFITCLFVTQQFVNWLVVTCHWGVVALAMCACLSLAYANEIFLPRRWLPWNINVCLMAAPLFYVGWQYRRRFDARFESWAVLLAVLCVALAAQRLIQPFNMKSNDYGTPLLALVAALVISVALVAIFRRLPVNGVLISGLALLGEASLVIMYLHWAVQDLARRHLGVEHAWLRVLMAIATPTLCYLLFRNWGPTRGLLLGAVADLSALFRRRPVASV